MNGDERAPAGKRSARAALLRRRMDVTMYAAVLGLRRRPLTLGIFIHSWQPRLGAFTLRVPAAG